MKALEVEIKWITVAMQTVFSVTKVWVPQIRNIYNSIIKNTF